jgi:hypothetical protein
MLVTSKPPIYHKALVFLTVTFCKELTPCVMWESNIRITLSFYGTEKQENNDQVNCFCLAKLDEYICQMNFMVYVNIYSY